VSHKALAAGARPKEICYIDDLTLMKVIKIIFLFSLLLNRACGCAHFVEEDLCVR
jgi:hypothetical protein